MWETISPTYGFVQDGIHGFHHRVPRELKRHDTSPRIACALGTRPARVAETCCGSAGRVLVSLATRRRGTARQAHAATSAGPRSRGERATAFRYLPICSGVRGDDDMPWGPKVRGNPSPSTVTPSGYVIDTCGDTYLEARTQAEANAFHDAVIARGLAGRRITWIFATVRAAVNFAASEQGLNLANAFAGIYNVRSAG